MTTLPKKTPEGYTLIFIKLADTNPNNFDFAVQLRYFDMVCTTQLYQEGTSEGHVVVADMKGTVFGHLTKAGPIIVKKFLFYLQEAMPVRLKGLHFFNIVPFMDKVLALIRPFLKMELMDMVLGQTWENILIGTSCVSAPFTQWCGGFGQVRSTRVLASRVRWYRRGGTCFAR